jgi:CheY-like chemotaxis protein
MLASSAQGVVQRYAASLASVATVDDAIAKCRQSNAEVLVIDLRSIQAAIDQVIGKLRTELGGGTPRILAVDQHVHELRLAAAREAGCDSVFTRGEFDRRLDDFLRCIASTHEK